MTAKLIFDRLKHCETMRIITKVYKDMDSLARKDDEGVVGFLCAVNSNLGKDDKLERVRLYCKKLELPVEVLDIEDSLTEFKIVIR